MELSTGGATASLPPGWQAPNGWPLTGNNGAIWRGLDAATEDDVKAVNSLGWSVDQLSLVGVYSRDWNAMQYEYIDRELLVEPWESFPCPGGLGSHAYQFQFMPEGIDQCVPPRVWIYTDGGNSAHRSQGGEHVHVVDRGAGHMEYHLGARPGSEAEGFDVQWDRNLRLHVAQ